MMLRFLIVAIIFAFSRGSNDESNDIEAGCYIKVILREALEKLKKQMDGVDDFNTSPLDPIELPILTIQDHYDNKSISFQLSNVTLSNLPVFNISSMRSEHLRWSINLTLPTLFIKGDYYIDGIYFSVPYYGSGNCEINVTDINLTIKGELQMNNESMVMDMLKLDLKYKHVTVFLENLVQEGNITEIQDIIIPGLGKRVLWAVESCILDEFQSALVRKVNKRLKNPIVKKIFKDIHPH